MRMHMQVVVGIPFPTKATHSSVYIFPAVRPLLFCKRVSGHLPTCTLLGKAIILMSCPYYGSHTSIIAAVRGVAYTCLWI